MNKPDFSKKARAIIENSTQPKNLDDFLSVGEIASNQTKQDYDEEITIKKFVREDFRFPEELSERLRYAAYKLHKKKINLVQEALHRYLKKIGF